MIKYRHASARNYSSTGHEAVACSAVQRCAGSDAAKGLRAPWPALTPPPIAVRCHRDAVATSVQVPRFVKLKQAAFAPLQIRRPHFVGGGKCVDDGRARHGEHALVDSMEFDVACVFPDLNGTIATTESIGPDPDRGNLHERRQSKTSACSGARKYAPARANRVGRTTATSCIQDGSSKLTLRGCSPVVNDRG